MSAAEREPSETWHVLGPANELEDEDAEGEDDEMAAGGGTTSSGLVMASDSTAQFQMLIHNGSDCALDLLSERGDGAEDDAERDADSEDDSLPPPKASACSLGGGAAASGGGGSPAACGSPSRAAWPRGPSGPVCRDNATRIERGVEPAAMLPLPPQRSRLLAPPTAAAPTPQPPRPPSAAAAFDMGEERLLQMRIAHAQSVRTLTQHDPPRWDEQASVEDEGDDDTMTRGARDDGEDGASHCNSARRPVASTGARNQGPLFWSDYLLEVFILCAWRFCLDCSSY